MAKQGNTDDRQGQEWELYEGRMDEGVCLPSQGRKECIEKARHGAFAWIGPQMP